GITQDFVFHLCIIKMITAKITATTDNYQVIEIVSSEPTYGTEAIQEALEAVSNLAINHTKGVVISHRGSIWLHSAVAHHFHVAAWVAHFDPRVGDGGGAVISQTHKRGFSVGDVISIPK
ncbi:MAG: CRISPR-associated ring nuclease Crn3/Csx3, partial [Sphaerospermopsis kisseleviana]